MKVNLQDSKIGGCVVCGEHGHRFLFNSSEVRHGMKGSWKIFRCEHCGLYSLFPVPKDLSKYYPKDYTAYYDYEVGDLPNYKKLGLKKYYGYSHLPCKDSLRESLKAFGYFIFTRLNGSKIIPFQKGILYDVGAGSGEFLASQKKLGWEVLGVDFSKYGCAFAKKKGVKVFCGDYLDFSLPKKAAVINATFILEHVKEPNAFFKKAAEELRTGGMLVFDVPNSNALDLALFKNNCYALDSPRHLFVFNKKNLSMLLSKHVFKLLRVTYTKSPFHFIKSINLWLKCRGHNFQFSTSNKLFYPLTLLLGLLGLSCELTVFAVKE